MIIIIIIFVILFLLLKLRFEYFLINRECDGAKKLNEITFGEEVKTNLPIAPYNDMPTEGADEAKKMPNPPGQNNKKNDNNDDKYVKMNVVNVKCDDKNYEFIGFKPDDLRDIDKSVIETKFGDEIVNNAKVIPLIFNDIKNTVNNNFDNPKFVKKIEKKMSKYEKRINDLYDWYKDTADLSDDPDNKASCQTDSDCTGGDHLNETEKGGFCDKKTNKCKCNKGWLGKTCSNKSYDAESAASRF